MTRTDACKSEPVRVACRHVFRAEDGAYLLPRAGTSQLARARALIHYTTIYYNIIIRIYIYIYRYHLPHCIVYYYYYHIYLCVYVNTNNDNAIYNDDISPCAYIYGAHKRNPSRPRCTGYDNNTCAAPSRGIRARVQLQSPSGGCTWTWTEEQTACARRGDVIVT
jgi:hypothetical protein